ncbi:MAG: hypothetical protein ABIY70_24150 [Capsulimonas sp.]|jgi:hypothetical protein|uniref:hypothetical protein n=1 Tax=Capsulimonas sp. TaxID=2494211 RepID=UPI003266831C|nr:hypothetical protein [Capsulimonas sp.]
MSTEEQTSAGTPPEPVTNCPTCKRKLLTKTSALCNWCGAKITDPNFQEQAAQIRLAADAAERARISAIIKEEGKFGVMGRLKRRAKGASGTLSPDDN